MTMTDKERLTKLVEESFADQHDRRRMIVVPDTVSHLLANGVVVREWIPVTERLPDDSATVNLCTRSRVVGTGFYNKYTKSWVQFYSGGSISVDVTHWMPLLEPPKEGE